MQLHVHTSTHAYKVWGVHLIACLEDQKLLNATGYIAHARRNNLSLYQDLCCISTNWLFFLEMWSAGCFFSLFSFPNIKKLINTFLAMASKIPKQNSIILEAIKSCGRESIFGGKTEVHPITGHMVINFVWCKLCLKYEMGIMSSFLVFARIAAHSFINGTTSVTNCQVCFAMTKDVRYRFYFWHFQQFVFLKTIAHCEQFLFFTSPDPYRNPKDKQVQWKRKYIFLF